MNKYEWTLATKRVKADATKALNQWKRLKSVGISEILRGMGYSTEGRDMYKFTKRYWAGMESFTLCLDTYGLIIQHTDKLDMEVK